jgi:hypothetical protein
MVVVIDRWSQKESIFSPYLSHNKMNRNTKAFFACVRNELHLENCNKLKDEVMVSPFQPQKKEKMKVVPNFFKLL